MHRDTGGGKRSSGDADPADGCTACAAGCISRAVCTDDRKNNGSDEGRVKAICTETGKARGYPDEIIKVENITVSDEDMDAQYELLAQKYNQPVDVVKQVLPKAQLKPDLLHMKASQLILDAAEIIMEEK